VVVVVVVKAVPSYGIKGVRAKQKVKSCNETRNFFPIGGKLKRGVPRSSIIGPLSFVIYINVLSLTIHSWSEPIIADDTSVIICSKNFDFFLYSVKLVLSRVCKWFAATKLVLNLHKTSVIKFITNNSPHCALNIGYRGEILNTKFLDVQIDNLHWKNHIDQMIPKISGECVMQLGQHSKSAILTTLNSIYCLFLVYNTVRNNFLR
jgi:hypothetical protein